MILNYWIIKFPDFLQFAFGCFLLQINERILLKVKQSWILLQLLGWQQNCWLQLIFLLIFRLRIFLVLFFFIIFFLRILVWLQGLLFFVVVLQLSELIAFKIIKRKRNNGFLPNVFVLNLKSDLWRNCIFSNAHCFFISISSISSR